MKKMITYSIIVGCFCFGRSQVIERFSIDSGGASVITGGIEILYTIGEVNVAERTSSTVKISEGFINGSLLPTLGINTPEISADKIIIYPNPTSDIINIRSEVEMTRINMHDVTGKLVFESSYLNKINVENFESGIYLLKLVFNDVSVTKRVIIK